MSALAITPADIGGFRSPAALLAHYAAVRARLKGPLLPLRVPAAVVPPVVTVPRPAAIAARFRLAVDIPALGLAADDIRAVIAGLDPEEVARPALADILAAVRAEWGLSRAEILSSRRTAAIVEARQVAMALSRHLTVLSQPEIGRRLGGRDHTTVLHALRKHEAMLRAVAAALPPDATVAQWAAACRRQCGGGAP